MRLPFVSAATYDWAIRHSERLADEAQHLASYLELEQQRNLRLGTRVAELLDTIVAMKRENFVVDIPVTNTALSVDEADEHFMADEEAKPGLLKRKLGT